jgi:hypothetical protein
MAEALSLALGALSTAFASATTFWARRQTTQLKLLRSRHTISTHEMTKLLREKDTVLEHLYDLHIIATELDELLTSVLSCDYRSGCRGTHNNSDKDNNNLDDNRTLFSPLHQVEVHLDTTLDLSSERFYTSWTTNDPSVSSVQMCASDHPDVNAYVTGLAQLLAWFERKKTNRTAIHALHSGELHTIIEAVTRLLHSSHDPRLRVPLIVQKGVGGWWNRSVRASSVEVLPVHGGHAPKRISPIRPETHEEDHEECPVRGSPYSSCVSHPDHHHHHHHHHHRGPRNNHSDSMLSALHAWRRWFGGVSTEGDPGLCIWSLKSCPPHKDRFSYKRTSAPAAIASTHQHQHYQHCTSNECRCSCPEHIQPQTGSLVIEDGVGNMNASRGYVHTFQMEHCASRSQISPSELGSEDMDGGCSHVPSVFARAAAPVKAHLWRPPRTITETKIEYLVVDPQSARTIRQAHFDTHRHFYQLTKGAHELFVCAEHLKHTFAAETSAPTYAAHLFLSWCAEMCRHFRRFWLRERRTLCRVQKWARWSIHHQGSSAPPPHRSRTTCELIASRVLFHNGSRSMSALHRQSKRVAKELLPVLHNIPPDTSAQHRVFHHFSRHICDVYTDQMFQWYCARMGGAAAGTETTASETATATASASASSSSVTREVGLTSIRQLSVYVRQLMKCTDKMLADDMALRQTLISGQLTRM